MPTLTNLIKRFNKAYSTNSGLAESMSDFEKVTKGIFSAKALSKKLGVSLDDMQNNLSVKNRALLQKKCSQEVERLLQKGFTLDQIKSKLDLTDLQTAQIKISLKKKNSKKQENNHGNKKINL